MAKIADAIEAALSRRAQAGGSGRPEERVLGQGDGWRVADVVCASGPHDRPFEERHAEYSIAIVAAGTFQYRSVSGCDLMTPGSLMLGSAGQQFECAHDHGAGDRCISFSFEPWFFENLAADAGARAASGLHFPALRISPVRELSHLVVRACSGVTAPSAVSWEELGIQLAARTVELLEGASPRNIAVPPSSVARVAPIVRMIEEQPDAPTSVRDLADAARLSTYHFIRTFEAVTGVTPHQFVLRTRLREAARRVANGEERILDIALDCGFGDVSNFNRSFRAEFGLSPRQFRARR